MLAAANRATGSEPIEIITRYNDRDRDLAREALRNDAVANEYRFFDRGDREADIKKMLKDGGKRVYDSQGRIYIEDKAGRIYSPDLHKTAKVLERRNIQHLGLTKTKYSVGEDGKVFKQGGTLKSEAAGWLRDKIKEKSDPNYQRNKLLDGLKTGKYEKQFIDKKLHAVDKQGVAHLVPAKFEGAYNNKTTLKQDTANWAAKKLLKASENWRKCGAIESGIVKAVIAHKAEQAQKQARRELEKQATGIKDKHIAQPQQIATEKQAEKAIKAQEKKTGFKFNEGQKEATKGILTSPDKIVLIQGYAGTAKTTSCLDAAAREMKSQGYTVTAMAPTNSAAQTLGTSIESDSKTVAKHLLDAEKSNTPGKQAWIVDEASMLSAKDMRKLIVAAEKADAKLVMVGDVKQLGSVEAGAAFRQLQEQSNLKTYKLDEIVRQRDDQLKSAVYDTIKGDTRAALDKMDTRQLKTRDERVQAIASDYAKLTPTERKETLVITPGRDDRALVNAAIREELKRDGTLTGETLTIKTLETKDLSTIEKKLAASYEPGDLIRNRLGGWEKVIEVDRSNNRLLVENQQTGKTMDVYPAKANAADMNTFRESTREIQVGDNLRSTSKNEDKGLLKGTNMTVEKINGDKITCTTDAGKTVTLDTSKTPDRLVDHAYASTAHAAQGKTCDRVFIHAESHRANLQTQQNNYVAASRAKIEARIYTDNKEHLIKQLDRNTGQKETAIERPDPRNPPPPGSEAEKDRKIKEGEIIRRELNAGKSIPEAIAAAHKEIGGEREAAKAVEKSPIPTPAPVRDLSRDRGMER